MNEPQLQQKIPKSTTNFTLTRTEERERLKNEQTATLNHFFVSVKKKLHYDKETIDYTSYIYFLIVLQLRLNYIAQMFNLIVKYGTKKFLIMHTISILVIGLPTYMFLLSMARFCRRGYIRFWHCIPILQGMGYTYALWINSSELLNIALSEMSFRYIKNIFSNKILPWSSCDFSDNSKVCVDRDYIIKSGSNVCLTFPALAYFKVVIQKQKSDSSHLQLVDSSSVIIIFVIWTVLFGLMICGFSSFQNKMKKVHIFTGSVWILTFFITLYRYEYYHVALIQDHVPWKLEFMLNVILFSLNQNTLSAMVWLCAINDSFSVPITDAIVVYSFKLVTLSILIMWVPVLLKSIINQYKGIDIECLNLSGFDIVFAVIPDILAHCPFSHILSALWFTGLLLHGFSSALYAGIATIDSLCDALPKVSQYRGHSCMLICTMCALINLVYVTRSGIFLMQTWIEYGNVIVCEIAVSTTILALIFIYSIQRLVDDYNFAFGVPPLKLWIELWKVTPFITLFQTVLTIYEYTLVQKVPTTNVIFVRWVSIAAALMLLPIVMVMLFKYLKLLKSHMVSSIIRPDNDWGYYIESKRIDRTLFNPQTEVRYKSDQLKCKHKCLVNSRSLARLQELNELHVNQIFEKLEKMDTSTVF